VEQASPKRQRLHRSTGEVNVGNMGPLVSWQFVGKPYLTGLGKGSPSNGEWLRIAIFASRLIRINATTEWTCSSTGWRDKCFEVPRRLCPVRRDRSWPCSAPQPASTSPPVQNANSHSERPHRRTIVPHRSISCEQRRCDQDHSLEQR